jgi:DNA-directed RNA polymerase specialized sigma24 family protein
VELKKAVVRAKAGDAEAFTWLVNRFQYLAVGYAYTALGDSHLAQDAVQEAFIAAYLNLPRLKEPEAFPGWLRSTVRHCCLRVLRRGRRCLPRGAGSTGYDTSR